MTRFSVRLTSDKQDQILSAIRAGGYPHIAALAWGVPTKVFAHWLEMGRRPRAREPYRSFALAVDEAHAQARLRAEMDVIFAVSACPQDQNATNGGAPTDLLIRVFK